MNYFRLECPLMSFALLKKIIAKTLRYRKLLQNLKMQFKIFRSPNAFKETKRIYDNLFFKLFSSKKN